MSIFSSYILSRSLGFVKIFLILVFSCILTAITYTIIYNLRLKTIDTFWLGLIILFLPIFFFIIFFMILTGKSENQ